MPEYSRRIKALFHDVITAHTATDDDKVVPARIWSELMTAHHYERVAVPRTRVL